MDHAGSEITDRIQEIDALVEVLLSGATET
jgi:hypothetical protein